MAHTIPVTVSESVATTALGALLAAFALLGVLFLVQENGQVLSPQAARYLHEATHDARHALGVPCH
ncbi:CbtB domain-containing protein [Nocardia sp. CA-135953]|uniref:CbtB domain-containing protein n=1 Tax=Nocardia sp. CA-135953 TaxID=3239978 RepID=UPI003D951E8C